MQRSRYDCIECGGGYSIQSFKILNTGFFVDDLKIGKWISYPQKPVIYRPKIKEIHTKYINGKKDSIEIYYGIKEIVKQIKWKDGIKDSIEFEIDLKGLKIFTYWNIGLRDSVLVYWNNGNLKFKGLYKNDQICQFKTYYINNQIKYDVIEINDFKAKEIFYYTEDGIQQKPRDSDLGIIGGIENVIQYY